MKTKITYSKLSCGCRVGRWKRSYDGKPMIARAGFPCSSGIRCKYNETVEAVAFENSAN